ncbi:MAG: UvrD-helicase domain-containing protein, partial [Bacteroidota bacterium]
MNKESTLKEKLKIFKSSAGSGKTFTLVKEYLKIVLREPAEYRHVLAITFTNKAAEEMKLRVIQALVSLEAGEKSDLRVQLEKEITGTPLTENASIVLRSILHDYPSFAISTIDSFFQKLLRSLAREFHLPLKVELKLEEEDAVLDVTDRLLKKSDEDPELADWLQQLMYRKLEDDKGWDIQSEISLIATEILKEGGASNQTLTRAEIHGLAAELTKLRRTFESSIRDEAQTILDGLKKFGLEPDLFYHRDKGVLSFLRKVHKGGHPDQYEIGSRADRAIAKPEGWLSKESAKDAQLVELIEREFQSHLLLIAQTIHEGYRSYVSCFQVLKTLHLFGIVNDLSRMFNEYRREHNQILISDTAKMLKEIISGNDTPFIYEKTGNKYKYLLIDEFQDTSEVQWLNLLPLVENSLSSGHMALVVG